MTTNDKPIPEVLSYGGGRQTVAMCLLVAREILPRPDRIVMADTGREARGTFDYLEQYVQPLMREHGMQVEIAPHSLANVDLYGKNGDLLLPAFTATEKLRTFCSSEWKGYVLQRYLRSVETTSAVQWIGFSTDEKKRINKKKHPNGESPWFLRYPLLELMLSRHDCEQLILKHGWPLPNKSACWMCPHRNNEEWRIVRDETPDEWEQACKLDDEIRENDEQGGVYLHQDRVPLREADLSRKDRGEPDRQCGLGNCML